jgi:hypothetical protein
MLSEVGYNDGEDGVVGVPVAGQPVLPTMHRYKYVLVVAPLIV